MRTTDCRAEIAGTVALRCADDGASVEAGDRIVEVECMKTLWPIVAPCAGVVRHRIELGQVVAQDEIVAVIESES
jgi:acetyl-CoA/propionyl-CoA carboxylase biotin carboxyl carrier protein